MLILLPTNRRSVNISYRWRLELTWFRSLLTHLKKKFYLHHHTATVFIHFQLKEKLHTLFQPPSYAYKCISVFITRLICSI